MRTPELRPKLPLPELRPTFPLRNEPEECPANPPPEAACPPPPPPRRCAHTGSATKIRLNVAMDNQRRMPHYSPLCLVSMRRKMGSANGKEGPAGCGKLDFALDFGWRSGSPLR